MTDDKIPPKQQPQKHANTDNYPMATGNLNNAIAASLRHNLHGIMDNTQFCDVTFCVDGVEFHGIRSLFAAQSAVFRNMLYGNYAESMDHSQPVQLNDITCDAFKYIRAMFYFQSPRLTSEIVVDVLYAAQIYFIQSLIAKCHAFVLNIERPKHWYVVMRAFGKYPQSTFYPFFGQHFIGCCRALNVADSIEHQRLLTLSSAQSTHLHDAEHYFRDKYVILSDHASFVSHLQHWQIEEMLKHGINDERMYYACLKWARHHCKSSSGHNGDGDGDGEGTAATAVDSLMRSIVHYFDFTAKFRVETVCQTPYLSKQKIIDILRCRLMAPSARVHRRRPTLTSSEYEDMPENENDGSQHEHEHKDVETEAVDHQNDDRNGDMNGDRDDEDRDNGFHLHEMLLTDHDMSILRVGDKLDHRDYKGRWCKATILQKSFMFIKLHYNGWNAQYDCWIHIGEEYEKLAKYGRITRRSVQRTQLQSLRVADYVMVRLPSCHRFHNQHWIKAKVMYIEEDTGQIKFSYGINNSVNDSKYSWWTHLDNLDECAPYRSPRPQQLQHAQHNHHLHHDDIGDDELHGVNDTEEVEILTTDDPDEDDNDEDDDDVNNANDNDENDEEKNTMFICD